jgi:hypothetical protein
LKVFSKHKRALKCINGVSILKDYLVEAVVFGMESQKKET